MLFRGLFIAPNPLKSRINTIFNLRHLASYLAYVSQKYSREIGISETKQLVVGLVGETLTVHNSTEHVVFEFYFYKYGSEILQHVL
jgi:hypothetical protein